MQRNVLKLAVTIVLMAAPLHPAWSQTSGGMFPEVPRGDQNNPPRAGGQFPSVPRGDQNNPQGNAPRPTGSGPTPPHDGHDGHGGHDRPVIIITPSSQGSDANDERLQALQRALRGPTGVTVNWLNASGSGQITPVGERLISGMNCRDVRQSVTTLGATDEAVATYCLTPAGEWMLTGP